MKILLVDDEMELVSAMAERLTMRGMDTHWADCGEDAVAMAGETAYDVAVLDMKMPKMSGLELQSRLSAAHPDMKFIFLSGHGSERDFKAGRAAGCAYLIKPIQIEELIVKIHELMD